MGSSGKMEQIRGEVETDEEILRTGDGGIGGSGGVNGGRGGEGGGVKPKQIHSAVVGAHSLLAVFAFE